ncbi:FMN-binding protein [Kaistia dalseonensis]|uniref:Uncharacterized protein with FMN-binding domain n=1 Tax=Kaistia dalseonensis TaxID=410840 RepID=A0ABU0HFA6_9HYPH|nr:FMN-binding protein [Kaistia dalseonensis]MCX5497535.1 FMN-binding protein [Kaistia dalseonensis]MDQ0440174.1 uncharacterized protein with FMN-binding domain [Kaistia dalseonensis]
MQSFQHYAATALLAASALSGVTPAQAAPAVPADQTAPAPASGAPIDISSKSGPYRDGSFTGPVYDAYYGLVQVKANVQGGRIVSIDVLQYPSDRRTSRAINSQALPMLEDEVISAQSGSVDIVSGATLTSTAYVRSLSKALAQARSQGRSQAQTGS